MAATGPPSPQEASSSASADVAKNGTAAAAADASSSQSSSQSAASPPPAGDKTANDASHAPTTQPAHTAAAKKPAAAMPTYLSAKSQRAYTLSRELLTTGQLEDALETLELGLQLSRRVLDATPNANNGDTKNDDDEVSYEG